MRRYTPPVFVLVSGDFYLFALKTNAILHKQKTDKQICLFVSLIGMINNSHVSSLNWKLDWNSVHLQ